MEALEEAAFHIGRLGNYVSTDGADVSCLFRAGSMVHKLDRVSLETSKHQVETAPLVSASPRISNFCSFFNENNNTKQTHSGQISSLTGMYKLYLFSSFFSHSMRCNLWTRSENMN